MSVQISAYSDISDTNASRAVGILTDLEVIGGYPDGSFRPNGNLTRAEFSKIIIKLIGSENEILTASRKTLFSDVTSHHWASGYVNLAYQNALMGGYGNGTFKPDNNLTYAEALTVLLRVLGYTESDIGKVYPDDYMSYAQALGLCDSVLLNASKTITRGECARLIIDCLTARTKSGTTLYKKLYPSSIDSAVLLDNDCISDEGIKNSAKLYSSSNTLYYEKATELSSSLIDSTGIVFIDGESKILSFIPEKTYTTVSGILLDGNRRAETGELPYEAVIYSDGSKHTYPRIKQIQDNLVGSSGSLIINENGYVTAFISDDKEKYTVVNDAAVIDAQGNVKMYVNGKITEYALTYDAIIDSDDIGYYGTLLLDEDGKISEFIKDLTNEYDIYEGTLTEKEGASAEFYIDGKTKAFTIACLLTNVNVGSSGIILVDSDSRVVNFIVSDSKGSTKSGAILLEINAKKATFLVNGSTVIYDQSYNFLDSSDIGSSGELVLDSDNTIVAFYTDGTSYDTVYGVLLYADTQNAAFSVNDDVRVFRTSSVSSRDVGQYGILLLNSSTDIESFVALENGYVNTDNITVTDADIDSFTDGNEAYSTTGATVIYDNDITAWESSYTESIGKTVKVWYNSVGNIIMISF